MLDFVRPSYRNKLDCFSGLDAKYFTGFTMYRNAFVMGNVADNVIAGKPVRSIAPAA